MIATLKNPPVLRHNNVIRIIDHLAVDIQPLLTGEPPSFAFTRDQVSQKE